MAVTSVTKNELLNKIDNAQSLRTEQLRTEVAYSKGNLFLYNSNYPD
jgi:hypothetical protein